MFDSRTYTDTLRLVSNGTTILPTVANYTDRYSVQENNGQYTLIIQSEFLIAVFLKYNISITIRSLQSAMPPSWPKLVGW